MNKKRIAALIMAATMAAGSCLTAYAEEQSTPQSAEASGKLEGSVTEKFIKVTLPTVEDAGNALAYLMDPEGLIQRTNKGLHGEWSIPESNADTQVYFKVGENTYENISDELKVTNESSHKINLTVKAEVENPAETDIALTTEDALTNPEGPAALYLGVIVGDNEPVAVSSTQAVESTVEIPGKPENFKVAVNQAQDGYEYRVLKLDEYQALPGNNGKTEIDNWVSTTFKMEGATTKGKSVTTETTAPKVKITWSYADPEETPVVVDAAPSMPTTTFAASETVWPVSLGSGSLAATSVTSVTYSGADLMSLGFIAWDAVNNQLTLTSGCVSEFTKVAPCTAIVTFDTGKTVDVSITK